VKKWLIVPPSQKLSGATLVPAQATYAETSSSPNRLWKNGFFILNEMRDLRPVDTTGFFASSE
jgi:hypothetical protein